MQDSFINSRSCQTRVIQISTSILTLTYPLSLALIPALPFTNRALLALQAWEANIDKSNQSVARNMGPFPPYPNALLNLALSFFFFFALLRLRLQIIHFVQRRQQERRGNAANTHVHQIYGGALLGRWETVNTVESLTYRQSRRWDGESDMRYVLIMRTK